MGDLVPQLPTIFSSPARLFPQTYRGIRFVSNEIPNLQLEGFMSTKYGSVTLFVIPMLEQTISIIDLTKQQPLTRFIL